MAFSFIKLISASDTLTKREAAILKICPPAIITSAEVIIAEFDAILGQWEHDNFCNHLSNYTNDSYNPSNIFARARLVLSRQATEYFPAETGEYSRKFPNFQNFARCEKDDLLSPDAT